MQTDENKTANAKSQNRLFAVLLAVIIAAVCGFNIYLFAVKHTAHHEDEYFNFSLANSYKKPFLYGSKLQVLDNYDTWMNGDDFKYYVKVNDDTRFKYDSVWHNQKEDTNPPLQYAITHTLCSIYQPDNYWIYGYAMNLICLIVMMIFLYLLVILICRSRAAGLLTCLFWGFSLIGQADVQFIRMYMMLTMFTVMYAYYTLRLMRMESPSFKNIIPAAVTIFLGTLTQHLFLAFAFFVTFFECAYFFFVKKRKLMLQLGFTALAAVVLSILAFPAIFIHLDPEHYKYPGVAKLDPQFGIFFRLLMRDTFGFFFELPDIRVYLIFIPFTAILIAPIVFVFRKETWMKKIISKIKAAGRFCLTKIKSFGNIVPVGIIIAAASLLSIIVVAGKVYFFGFGKESIRYLYFISPFVCALPISFLFYISEKIKRKHIRLIFCGAVTAAFSVMLISQNILHEPRYLISAEPDNGYIHDHAKNMSGIALTATPEVLPAFCSMLEDSNDIYATTIYDETFLRSYQLEKLKKLFDRNEEFFLCLDNAYVKKNVTVEPDTKFDVETIEKYMIIKDKIENDAPYTEEEEKFYDDFYELMTLKNIVYYFEQISGYKAEYQTSENTHYFRAYLYIFKPQN